MCSRIFGGAFGEIGTPRELADIAGGLDRLIPHEPVGFTLAPPGWEDCCLCHVDIKATLAAANIPWKPDEFPGDVVLGGAYAPKPWISVEVTLPNNMPRAEKLAACVAAGFKFLPPSEERGDGCTAGPHERANNGDGTTTYRMMVSPYPEREDRS